MEGVLKGAGPAADFAFGRFVVCASTRQVLVDDRPAKIGARTLDLLLVLIEHRDRVVSKNELLEQVWPGLVVEENNLPVHISALRKLFGVATITTVPGRGYRFTAQALTSPAATVAVPAATPAADGTAGTPSSQPEMAPGVPTAPHLYGRSDDMARLRRALCEHALVTLVGPGGIGKTVLARATARELESGYRDGVRIVELAALTDDAMVPDAVSVALQLRAHASDPLEALASALCTRDMLLVLDNCEHLVGAVAALVDRLRHAAPQVRVLATSQAPLNLAHEQRLRLDPLALPAARNLESARAASAVALFEARAREADARFAITPDNVDSVISICRQLDGIPLALEMAAARMQLLGAEGLAARLSDRFKVVKHGTRLALARHQTLLAALDWSHSLLSAAEQVVLRRLSVFAGGFSVDSAQQVVSDDSMDAWEVLDLFGQLVDKSLVVASAGHGGATPRFTLLETVRSFAAEQLERAGEREPLRRRHAQHMLQWSQTQLKRQQGKLAYRKVPACAELEIDNLRASLDWAQQWDVGLGLELLAEWLYFWRERGHHGEALRRAAALLDRAGEEERSPARGEVLLGACGIAFEQGDATLCDHYAASAFENYAALGSLTGQAQSLLRQSSAMSLFGRWSEALDMCRRALVVFRDEGNLERAAVALVTEACYLGEMGTPELGLPALREGTAIFHQIGDRWGHVLALENLGEALYGMGDYQGAKDAWTEAIGLFRGMHHAHRLTCIQHHLGCAELMLGRLQEAKRQCAEALRLARAHGFAYFKLSGLSSLARVAMASNRPARAAQLLAAFDAAMTRAPMTIGLIETQAIDDARNGARAALGELGWEKACAAGRLLTLDQAIQLALEEATPAIA